MKILLHSCIITLFFTTYSTAQITFQKTFGGSSFDVFSNAALTSDSGYILTGFTESSGAGSHDLYLVRTNAAGDTLWSGAYGGEQSDEGYAVVETFDGGFVAAGYTESFHALTSDVYVLKTNSNGDVLWSRRFDSSADDLAFSIQQTSDSGFILTGRTTSLSVSDNDIFLIRLNSSGDTLWTKLFVRMTHNDAGYSVIESYDGGFVITGYVQYGFSNTDLVLIKTDNTGHIIWSNSYGGFNLEYGWQIQQTPDSSYVVAGSSSSNVGNYDFTFLKTDSLGVPQIINVYEGSDDDQAKSLVQLSDGGFLLAGSSNSFIPLNTDAYIIRTDQFGNPIWSRTYGGINTESGIALLPSTGNGFMLSGNTTTFGGGLYDCYMIRIDSSGNSGCNDTSQAVPNILPGFTHVPVGILEMAYAPLIFFPGTINVKGSSVHDICLSSTIFESNEIGLEIYPNPSDGSFKVAFDKTIKSGEIEISNLLGEIILKINVEHEIQKDVHLKNVEPGIYFLNFRNDGMNHVQKIVVE